jgi:NADP-dependent 3-hydroxy acid dehydrogenase YdfG
MAKRIIVTGGSKGIGKAIILKYAAMGYDIATCARNTAELVVLKNEILKKYPDQEIIAEKCDVTNADEIAEWSKHVKTKWNTLDILINNAGTFLPGSVITEDEKSLPFQIETNLYSAYRFTRSLIPLLEQNNSGHIFNMCSIASIAAYPGGGAYTISKFALYGFTKCLREDLKKTNIKVTAVLPGAVWTESWQGSGFTQNDMIQSADIAELIWQCSQLSKQAVVEDLIIRPQGGDL